MAVRTYRRVLWVAKTGSDSNVGSFASPFLTIQKACSVVLPGDTVMVMPGTYAKMLSITRSGTETARIRFVSSQSWGAKIAPPSGTTSPVIWLVKANYIDIEGFEITGEGSPVVRIGILMDGNGVGNYAGIYHNHIHDIKAQGETGMGGAAIVDAAGGYLGHGGIIAGNWIHDMGYLGEGFSPRVHGIYTASPDVLVCNNITFRNQSFGLHANHSPIRNVYANNLSFANGDGALYHNDASIQTNCVFANNILLGSIGGRGVGDKFVTNYNNSTLSVGFVNYQPNGTGNYHLVSSSQCINTGTNQYAPQDDYDGINRPRGTVCDIGPYEF